MQKLPKWVAVHEATHCPNIYIFRNKVTDKCWCVFSDDKDSWADAVRRLQYNGLPLSAVLGKQIVI